MANVLQHPRHGTTESPNSKLGNAKKALESPLPLRSHAMQAAGRLLSAWPQKQDDDLRERITEILLHHRQAIIDECADPWFGIGRTLEKKQFPPSAPEVADWCDRKTSEYQQLVAAAVAPAKSAAPNPRWQPIFERLKSRYGEAVAASWFSRVTLGGIANGTATVEVPTKFLCSWLTEHYESHVRDAIASFHPEVTKVCFVERTAAAISGGLNT